MDFLCKGLSIMSPLKLCQDTENQEMYYKALCSFSILSRGLLTHIFKLHCATMQNCSFPNDGFARGGGSKDRASWPVLFFLEPALYYGPAAIIN